MNASIISLLLAMQIDGGSRCPAAAEVGERLLPLLSPGFAAASTDRALIVEDEGGVSLSLVRPDGKTIARRRLPRAPTCAEQAETVAVTLAVWEAQIHPEIALRLDRLAARPSTAPVDPPPAPGTPALARSAEPSRASEPSAAVGGAVLAGWQGGSLAPGGRIDGTVGRSWRARLSVAALGDHTMSLPPGEAAWWRAYLAAGVDYALPVGRRWQLAAGAGGVLGVMTAHGTGFSMNRTARSVDLGVEAMLRIELRLAAVRPWFGVGLLTWLRRQTVDVTGDATSAALPRLEPLLALGADFSWRP